MNIKQFLLINTSRCRVNRYFTDQKEIERKENNASTCLYHPINQSPVPVKCYIKTSELSKFFSFSLFTLVVTLLIFYVNYGDYLRTAVENAVR